MENTGGFSCTCTKCGRILYEGEMLNIKGKYVCENCADAYIFSPYAGGRTAEPRPKRRVPSAFFHLMFSFHPGVGHMFLGLMKKGLFQMCLFYLCIYLTSMMPHVFAFVLPVVWIYSFFDQISTRRRVANGENVKDDISGITNFLSTNRRLVVIALIAVAIIGAANSRTFTVYKSEPRHYSHEVIIEDGRHFNRGRSIIGLLQPIALIGLGGIILTNVGKKNKASEPPKDGSNDWTYESLDK